MDARMDERLKKLLRTNLVDIHSEAGEFTLVFKKDNGESARLTVRDTGGIGADGEWYTFPAVYLDGKEVWRG